MKQYVIDELRPKDFEKIRAYMHENFEASTVGDVFWIDLDQNLLTDVQAAHKDCRPFYFAVELAPERICCELLVRTKNRIKCSCMGYATEKQRNWFISVIDAIFEKLAILA